MLQEVKPLPEIPALIKYVCEFSFATLHLPMQAFQNRHRNDNLYRVDR
jgi:hypothetical protein